MAFIYVFQWHRTLFAPAIRLYLCMSQVSICSSIVNGLHNWVFFNVMFQKYFKIVVLLKIISFTFLALLKTLILSDTSKGLSDTLGPYKRLLTSRL